MKSVNVAELKNRLSHYIRQVRRGQPLLVMSRDRVVARLEPAGDFALKGGADAEWLTRLELQGIVRRGVGRIDVALLRRRPAVSADVVDALIEERRGGR
jgi:prevent-host-death family protein